VKRYIILLAAVVLIVTGCVSSRELRAVQYSLGTRIGALENDLTSLKKEHAQLRENLDQLEARNKTLRKSQADAGADVTTLRDEVQKLRGELETLGRGLSVLDSDIKGKDAVGISRKLDDISFRIQYLENFIGVGKKADQEKEPKKGEEGRKDSSVQKSIDREKAYANAYESFKDGKYPEARQKFGDFVKTFPDTEYSDNAQFWIGESYYFEKEYEKAILEYETVIKNYPKGNKVPNALLKQALSFMRLGDNDSAKLLLQRVIKEYPNTSPARIARKMLSEN
jgi:tol-pal system protein YbgF